MEGSLPQEKEMIENIITDPHRYAAIYARESNKNAPNALETQKYACRKYAHEKGLLIYGIYSQFGSAFKEPYFKREKFMKMLEDARLGCFKSIIVTRRDRVTRNFDEFIKLRNMFEELGIQVLYSNDIQLNEENDYACTFIENIIMALAEMEPRRINKRSEDGRRAKALKGIYDKLPPIGLLSEKDTENEKYKKKYYKDGARAQVVGEIFNIYLRDKSVKQPKDVLVRLEKNISNYEGKKEYQDIIKSLDADKIKKILSRPLYAGLCIRNIDYKYKEFYINHNSKVMKVDKVFFHECVNVESIITPSDWYEAVEKWYENKESDKAKNKKIRREKNLFEGLFKCRKCNEVLKYEHDMFSCRCEDSRRISKSVLIRNIIKAIVEWIGAHSKGNEIIEEAIRKLKEEQLQKQKDLSKLLNEQTTMLKSYLNNKQIDDLSNKVRKNISHQKLIKQKIKEISDKVDFLSNKFKDIIIPLTKANYIHMIADELEKNQSAILELFISESIKELKINGKSISIQSNSSKEKG